MLFSQVFPCLPLFIIQVLVQRHLYRETYFVPSNVIPTPVTPYVLSLIYFTLEHLYQPDVVFYTYYLYTYLFLLYTYSIIVPVPSVFIFLLNLLR